MKYDYHDFVACLKEILEFREHWDDEEWNQAYMAFKRRLEICSPEWIECHNAIELYINFAEEFYQKATSETHDYWLRKSN